MRSLPTVVLPVVGLLLAPLCSQASTVTGSSPTEVSTHVDGSLAGSTTGPEQQNQHPNQRPDSPGRVSDEPAVAAGMALADFSGLPLMLVGPPQSYSLAPRGKLRSLAGEVSAPDSGGMSNVGYQAGNGNGGTASVGSVGVAPQQVPEPLTILLAAPALALAVRRRMQRRA
jgi:hypothetical protein